MKSIIRMALLCVFCFICSACLSSETINENADITNAVNTLKEVTSSVLDSGEDIVAGNTQNDIDQAFAEKLVGMTYDYSPGSTLPQMNSTIEVILVNYDGQSELKFVGVDRLGKSIIVAVHPDPGHPMYSMYTASSQEEFDDTLKEIKKIVNPDSIPVNIKGFRIYNNLRVLKPGELNWSDAKISYMFKSDEIYYVAVTGSPIGKDGLSLSNYTWLPPNLFKQK